MPSNPHATVTRVTVETEDTQRIKRLEAEARRHPFYSPVFQETIALLKKHSKPVEETMVQITMPKEQAERLYGLLGQITAHSGFDPIFQSLHTTPNVVLRRIRPKLHFVRDNVLTAEY